MVSFTPLPFHFRLEWRLHAASKVVTSHRDLLFLRHFLALSAESGYLVGSKSQIIIGKTKICIASARRMVD